MEHDKCKRQKLIAKYSELVKVKTGGIFTSKTRQRMLGVSGPGRDMNGSKQDFWYDQRKHVEMALKDLEFFIEATDDNNVNLVITEETLSPIVNELLWGPVYFPPDPDRAKLYLERAKIADLFIREGFRYLSSMNSDMMSIPHKNAMVAAIDLSQFLLATFKKEWPYYPEIHGKHQDKTGNQGDECQQNE